MRGKTGLWLACALILALAALLLSGGDEARSTQEERRIADVLGSISGAGKVEVAIYYTQQEEGAFGAEASAPRPAGAVIVAEGAQDMAVRLKLIRAMRVLLGLPENAVDVFEMEEGRW